MRKQEFMDQLRSGLDGNVSYEKYKETIEYYEAYFEKRKAEGKTEEEICDELGSGRLIAKTIIETMGQDEAFYTGQSGSVYRTAEQSRREYADGTPKGWRVEVDDMGNTKVCFGKIDFSTILGKILIGIGLVLLAALVIGLVFVGVKILLYVVLPLAVILFLVNLILSLVDSGRK